MSEQRNRARNLTEDIKQNEQNFAYLSPTGISQKGQKGQKKKQRRDKQKALRRWSICKQHTVAMLRVNAINDLFKGQRWPE